MPNFSKSKRIKSPVAARDPFPIGREHSMIGVVEILYPEKAGSTGDYV